MRDRSYITEVQPDEGRYIIARLLTKALAVCVFALIIGIFADISNSNTLIAWAILSAVFLWVYTMLIVKTALSGGVIRSWGGCAFSLGSIVPWAFSAYLFFYRGLWRLSDLLDRFSWLIIGEAFVFVFMGYLLINALYPLSEIGRKVTEKTLRFKD